MSDNPYEEEEFTLKFTYRWGFDSFKTPRRYGLGIEFYPREPLIAVRFWHWWVSWGLQRELPPVVAYTNSRSWNA